MKKITCIKKIIEIETQIYHEFDIECKKSILKELSEKTKPSIMGKLFKSKVEDKSVSKSKMNNLTRWFQKVVVNAHRSALTDLMEEDTQEELTNNIFKLMDKFDLCNESVKYNGISKNEHSVLNEYNLALIQVLDIDKLISIINILDADKLKRHHKSIQHELNGMGMSHKDLIIEYLNQREEIAKKVFN
jgi:hypothetical protein